MDTINIMELGRQTREAQLAMGSRQDTVWFTYLNAIDPIIKRHLEYGKNEFDYDTVSTFMREQEKRLRIGEIKPSTFENYKQRGANRLTEMHEKGCLRITCTGRPSKFVLNDYYEQIIKDFLADRNWHTNTRGDVNWVARKFLFWLLRHGFEDFTSVGAKEIQGFIVHCSEAMRISGVHNVKLYMKHLCDYLFQHELLSSSFSGLLSFKRIFQTMICK